MARPWLQVYAFTKATFVIKGPGAGKLIVQAGGKPMWSRALRGYSTSERIATQVMALAEHEGRRVRYDDLRAAKLVDLSPGPEAPRTAPPEAVQLGFDLGDAS